MDIANNLNNRPISHTIPKVCALTGFGPTTIWKLIREGRLKVVRVPGIKRTLVTDESVVDLLRPTSVLEPPQPRRRGRPCKSFVAERTA